MMNVYTVPYREQVLCVRRDMIVQEYYLIGCISHRILFFYCVIVVVVVHEGGMDVLVFWSVVLASPTIQGPGLISRWSG